MGSCHTVVVGFDASPESAPALRFATEEAQLRHARLLVVTAYDRPIDPDLDDFDIPDSNLKEAARARAEKALHLTLGRPTVRGLLHGSAVPITIVPSVLH